MDSHAHALGAEVRDPDSMTVHLLDDALGADAFAGGRGEHQVDGRGHVGQIQPLDIALRSCSRGLYVFGLCVDLLDKSQTVVQRISQQLLKVREPKTGASQSCHPLFSVHFLWPRVNTARCPCDDDAMWGCRQSERIAQNYALKDA